MSILMVDDEPDLEPLIRQKFRRQIGSGELQFTFALNGQEALEKLAADTALDIIVSDINMPVMDGLTLLSRLANYPRPVKTIMVSAYDDMPNIRTAMNRGAFDFLTKPIEFADLETTLAKTRKELDVIRAGEQAREHLTSLQSELEIATRIQQSILPDTIINHDQFEVSASMLPARQVGGDFYDFFLIDSHRLGLCIGDVSGKGIPAALFMAVCRTLLRATALHGGTADECLTHMNEVLLRQSKSELFVTLFYGILDLRTGELSYSAGGQTPPYLLSCSGESRLLREPRGCMLGILDEATYEAGHAKLNPKDVLLLYTDGVTEADDASSQYYGEQRLAGSIEPLKDAPISKVVEGVLAGIDRFTNGYQQSDDITVLAVRYLGPQPPE